MADLGPAKIGPGQVSNAKRRLDGPSKRDPGKSAHRGIFGRLEPGLERRARLPEPFEIIRYS
jgi:hypothetical protein